MNGKPLIHTIIQSGIIASIILIAFMQAPAPQVSAQQPSPTLPPSQLIKTDPVPFPVKAPWPAGASFHLGGYIKGVNEKEGYFYYDSNPDTNTHLNGTRGSRDYYALDINGNGSKSEPEIDSDALVLAVADGIVKVAGDNGGYGNSVVIEHVSGYQSRYAHLRGVPLVKVNEWVAQGTPLGYIGNSGCNTGQSPCGDHLHFSMYYCDPTIDQKKCDEPQNKFAAKPEPFDGNSGFKTGAQITSTNYGVGYEKYEISIKGIKTKKEDIDKLYHKFFTYTYQVFGGEATVFGMSESPVKIYGNTDYLYQEFGEYKYDINSIWYGLKSVLFEHDNVAYLIGGKLWEEYDSRGGPNSSLGLPVSQTYYWQEKSGNSTYNGLRCDFQNGSIIWLQHGGVKVLDSSNAPWQVSFYRMPNFTDLAFTRMDEHINLYWHPQPMSAILPQNLSGITSLKASTTVDIGLVPVYQIKAEFQGNLEVLSNGNTVIPLTSSEDKAQPKTSTNLQLGRPNLEVRFWQTPLKQAEIKISAEGFSIIPKVYAAEDYQAQMEGLNESPKITYADFDPPPYDDGSSTPNPGNPFSGASTSVLVFDTSGSMSDFDAGGSSKIDAARSAGIQILNVIASENSALNAANQVGIVKYSTYASVVAPLSSDMSSMVSALSTLAPEERTGMPDGLKMGIELFGASQGKQALILLSDGLPNIGLNTDMSGNIDLIKQQVLDLASEAGQKGICVYTVGFGDPSEGIGSIDEGFLQQVAGASGCGQYYNARNAIDLANIYVELRHTSTGNVILNQVGKINQDQDIDLGTVTVDSNQETMLFTLNWPGSRLQPTLIDPIGVTVDPNYPGASISSTSSLVSIIVNNPQAGDWMLRIFGADVPEGTTDYKAIISTRLGPVIIPTVAPVSQPISTGAPLALFTIIVAGGLVGVYAYSRSLRHKNIMPVTKSEHARGQLRGTSGIVANRKIILRDDDTLGRGPKNTINLNDPSISRSHAVFRYANGAWFIQDLNSSGGIMVNGERISAMRLNHGDQVKIGNQIFVFETE